MKYILKKSLRAKNLRITVKTDGSVILTRPFFIRKRMAEDFLEDKIDWVEKNIRRFKRSHERIFKQVKKNRKDYLKNKERARYIIEERLQYFCYKYNFKYQKVRIKNQKTVWGSCSQKGNLNFNYKLIYLPEELLDYVVVHELCHLKELNHSKKYWQIVSEIMPSYKECRKKLRSTKIT